MKKKIKKYKKIKKKGCIYKEKKNSSIKYKIKFNTNPSNFNFLWHWISEFTLGIFATNNGFNT